VADKKLLFEASLRDFAERESLGVVNDMIFVRCFWPQLDTPTPLFADGSSGIEVAGPPTPRNVIFPPDTVFLPMVSSDGRVLKDMPTRGDMFTEKRTMQQEVDEVVRVTEVASVRGKDQSVTYDEVRKVMREVEVSEQISLKEAATRGKVDRVEIVPLVKGA
jgi:hypothetical protein